MHEVLRWREPFAGHPECMESLVKELFIVVAAIHDAQKNKMIRRRCLKLAKSPGRIGSRIADLYSLRHLVLNEVNQASLLLVRFNFRISRPRIPPYESPKVRK